MLRSPVFAVSALLLVASLASPALGSAVPLGSEFVVNSATTGYQVRPVAAQNDTGLFVVTWISPGQDGDGAGVFARRFNFPDAPLGSEFQVNTYTTNEQFASEVGMDDSGAFRIVWQSNLQRGGIVSQDDVYGRTYDGTGAAQGGEFTVNTYTTNSQYHQAIAMSGDGSFVVAWNSFGAQDGDRNSVHAQRFDSAGTLLGSELLVNTFTTEDQRLPAVAVDDQGAFTVVWQDDTQDGSDSGVFGRRYDSSGSSLGGEFQVNTWTTEFQMLPAIAMNRSGRFVVTWTSRFQDGSNNGVFGQVYDSAGIPVGGEIQVNSITQENQSAESVAMDDAGNFIVAWNSNHIGLASQFDVFARRFRPDGRPLEPEFRVNSYTTSSARTPSVSMDSVGNFVVAWNSQDGGIGPIEVRARSFAWNAPILISPADLGSVDCTDPRLIRPTVTWIGDTYDRFKVFMGSDPAFVKGTRVTSESSWIKTESWTPSRKKWRRACRKALESDPIQPVLYFQIVGKDRDLSKKDPFRILGSLINETAVQL